MNVIQGFFIIVSILAIIIFIVHASQHPISKDNDIDSVGLAAIGTSNSWIINVDETLDEPHKWFLQLESKNCYLYFQISEANIIQTIHEFLIKRIDESKYKSGIAHSWNVDQHELTVSDIDNNKVEINWDTETNDGFTILAGQEGSITTSILVQGKEVSDFIEALEQTIEDLANVESKYEVMN